MPQWKPTPLHYKARCEVLWCVVCLLSAPMFQNPQENTSAQRWLKTLVNGSCIHSANLFCSLMSTALRYDPFAWSLPYATYLCRGTEEDLADVGLQLLCVLLEYNPMSLEVVPEHGTHVREVSPEVEEWMELVAPQNVFTLMLHTRENPSELDLMFEGMVRLLGSVPLAADTFLPASHPSVDFHQEALILLWRMVSVNCRFRRRVCERDDTNTLVMPLLYLLQQGELAREKSGGSDTGAAYVMHTISLILLVLSSEPGFCVRVNEPYVHAVPLVLTNFSGNGKCSDVLMFILLKVVSNGLRDGANDVNAEVVLAVLCNISDHIKAPCAENCLKIASIMDRCARPNFIVRSLLSHRCLGLLLETVVNIIQHQFEHSFLLMYEFLRQKDIVDRLEQLCLPSELPTHVVFSGGQPWQPTSEWLDAWKETLPLLPLRLLVDFLVPRVEKEFDGRPEQAAEILRTLCREEFLPAPKPVTRRTWMESAATAAHLSAHLWSAIVSRAQEMPLFDTTKIRLPGVVS